MVNNISLKDFYWQKKKKKINNGYEAHLRFKYVYL